MGAVAVPYLAVANVPALQWVRNTDLLPLLFKLFQQSKANLPDTAADLDILLANPIRLLKEQLL